jgi:hypothetical protein
MERPAVASLHSWAYPGYTELSAAGKLNVAGMVAAAAADHPPDRVGF